MIDGLHPSERKVLKAICEKIRAAEEELQRKAQPLMQRCIERCGGICCRNVDIDAIISHWDFVYIMTLRPDLGSEIDRYSAENQPLFTSDCCFLLDGIGPCLFPFDLRPEVCLATFCSDDRPVKHHIRRLKREFIRLSLFMWLRKPRAVLRKLQHSANRSKQTGD